MTIVTFFQGWDERAHFFVSAIGARSLSKKCERERERLLKFALFWRPFEVIAQYVITTKNLDCKLNFTKIIFAFLVNISFKTSYMILVDLFQYL